jgi:tetratricopeptide (TPR) repeat protein
MFLSGAVHAASTDKAQLLNEHGLRTEAKAELIDVISGSTSDSEKAFAYYLLGSIAFDERRVGSALNAWSTLVSTFPTSQYAQIVSDRLQELSQIVGEAGSEVLDNVVAQSYLQHADFWSAGKDTRFTIDSSWIPNVEAANDWYDKVIAEFPGTPAAERAYVGKLRTILGWKSPGQYGTVHGVEGDFHLYMPLLLTTFESYIGEFPNASTAQAFRYQIAQAYWAEKNWDKTREWLNLIIQEDNGSMGFYMDLAQRRLQKVEY